MNTPGLWATIIAAGLITYGIRLSFIVGLGKRTVPDSLRRALRFVPPAVLSAIIFPEMFRPGGHLDVSPGNVRMWAGLLAALVAWRTKNILLTIAAGMGALWVLQVILNSLPAK
jgi:branched-subunit amino acid transport protein